MDKRVLEAMDAVRKVVRFDEMHGCNHSDQAVNELVSTLRQAGAGVEDAVREMADQFCEAQRQVHRATQRILRALEG